MKLGGGSLAPLGDAHVGRPCPMRAHSARSMTLSLSAPSRANSRLRDARRKGGASPRLAGSFTRVAGEARGLGPDLPEGRHPRRGQPAAALRRFRLDHGLRGAHRLAVLLLLQVLLEAIRAEQPAPPRWPGRRSRGERGRRAARRPRRWAAPRIAAAPVATAAGDGAPALGSAIRRRPSGRFRRWRAQAHHQHPLRGDLCRRCAT